MEKLALDGGQRAIPESMAIANWPAITEEDIEHVVTTMRRGPIWGSDAPNVAALEKEWAAYCGARYCKGTNGGTAAIHMALAAAGVGPGTEVIVPAYSFHSSASAILHHNAIPRFVDIDFSTYTIDPARVEASITPNTRAIIGVDLFGLPANWPEINKIAREHGLVTIEDACQSHGAAIGSQKTGTLGDIAAFSLNGSKNLPGAEGGLITTNDGELFGKTGILDMDVRTVDGRRVYPEYSFGWNYRMNELSAALTRSRLKHLDELNAIRKENCTYLSNHLRHLDGLVVPRVPDRFHHVFHMYKLAISPSTASEHGVPVKEFRDTVMFALAAEGVRISTWVQSVLPSLPIYQVKEGYGRGCPWSCPFGAGPPAYDPRMYPEANRLIESTFNIDGFVPPASRDYLDMVVHAFEKVWQHIGEFFSG